MSQSSAEPTRYCSLVNSRVAPRCRPESTVSIALGSVAVSVMAWLLSRPVDHAWGQHEQVFHVRGFLLAVPEQRTHHGQGLQPRNTRFSVVAHVALVTPDQQALTLVDEGLRGNGGALDHRQVAHRLLGDTPILDTDRQLDLGVAALGHAQWRHALRGSGRDVVQPDIE